jgi:hypothetical protein
MLSSHPPIGTGPRAARTDPDSPPALQACASPSDSRSRWRTGLRRTTFYVCTVGALAESVYLRRKRCPEHNETTSGTTALRMRCRGIGRKADQETLGILGPISFCLPDPQRPSPAGVKVRAVVGTGSEQEGSGGRSARHGAHLDAIQSHRDAALMMAVGARHEAPGL